MIILIILYLEKEAITEELYEANTQHQLSIESLIKQVEKLQEELNDERQLSSSLMKERGKQVTASENDEIVESLKTKLDDGKKEEKKLRQELQEEIESLQQQLQQVKDHKEVGVQFDYLIPQSGMCVCVCVYW